MSENVIGAARILLAALRRACLVPRQIQRPVPVVLLRLGHAKRRAMLPLERELPLAQLPVPNVAGHAEIDEEVQRVDSRIRLGDGVGGVPKGAGEEFRVGHVPRKAESPFHCRQHVAAPRREAGQKIPREIELLLVPGQEGG